MKGTRNLFGLSREQMVAAVSSLSLPAYRGRQIYRWIYARGARGFAEMTDLPKPLRDDLESRFVIRRPATTGRRRSSDGTVKTLFSIGEGKSVEAVYIPDPPPSESVEAQRHTVCLSTQVGCPLKCSFCYSGTIPFLRNLSAGEILGQFLTVKQSLHPQPKRMNVVFMGMGEPLLNSQAVLDSLRVMTDPDGLAISPRRITVSTAGLAKELERFAQKAPAVGIAVSLHATTDETRSRIMPINRKYDLDELLQTIRRLPLPRRRKITFEYVLLGGENDSEQDAERLARLLRGIKSKINLISYNPWPGSPHKAASPDAVDRFTQVLINKKYTVSMRRSRGDDILAACGQLAGRVGDAV